MEKLLKRSALRVSFQIDESGDISRSRVEQSSRVPSIDHLAVELVLLLEKYQFLSTMTGLRRVLLSIQVEENIEIRLEGEASDEAAAEEGDKLAGRGDDRSQKSRILASKNVEKEPLVDFLMRYYRTEPSKD